MCAICAILFAGAQTPANTFVSNVEKELPKELGQGLVMKTATYDPDAQIIVIGMEVDSQVVPFAALKASHDMMQQAMVAEMLTATDAETVMLRDAIKAGNTLQYLFKDGADTFTISVTPADLK